MTLCRRGPRRTLKKAAAALDLHVLEHPLGQRWPPSPRVEDETASLKKELSKEGKPIPVVLEDDGVQMRGTPDQNPIVKDADDDSESLGSHYSSEDSAPTTPQSTVDDTQDRGYVWKPEDDDRIPLNYGGSKNPSTTAQRRAPVPQEKERGRRDVPRLDTEFARDKSRADAPPPLERARSPYASGPKPSRPKQDRFSGEHKLSPEFMSPGVKYAEGQRSHSYYDPRIATDDSSRNLDQIKHDPERSGRPALASSGRHASAYGTTNATYGSTGERDQREDTYDHPTRPSLAPLGRHASAAVVYPGASLSHSMVPPQLGYHRGSSDESDASRGSGGHRKGPNPLSAQNSPKFSASHFTDRSQRQHSSRQPTLTPPELIPEHRGPATNRASLLSGDFLLGINARLEHDIAGARRASPRPSPQPSPMASPRGSPTTSPFSSPPRTPPNEDHHRRTHTVIGLKNEVQRPRPLSPLSSNSTPRTPRTPGTGVHAVEADLTGRPRHAAPRSRMTTPLPSPTSMVEPEPILGPGISVRSPSPAVHANYRSDRQHEPQYSHHLMPRAPEPHGEKTICDLNDPWIRLATQMTMNQIRPDLDLLTALAKTTAKQRPCMEDKSVARHHWYRLEDEETGKHIPDFNICQHCVYSLEIIFPVLKEVFYMSRGHHSEAKERVCSLRSDGHNFVQYINVLDQVAAEARKSHKEPNTAPLARLARQFTQDPESPKTRTTPQSSSHLVRPKCPRDQMLPNLPWHIHPRIPEFTICPSCYNDVVLPAVIAGHPIARAMDHSPHKVDQRASCHLYSPRMRTVFNEACEDDDFEHLRHTAHRRHLLQQDLLDVFQEGERHPDDEEVKERGRGLYEEWKRKE
ncbi:MAG: hypothetical protein ASARMPRED_003124 [Alectoria sarmentosa]|nr:MAG: hypothetical protein ASARMPRED_003124 [Alectoria sarmentosa]